MNGKRFWFSVLFVFGLLFRPPILPIDLLLPLTLVSLYGILREVMWKGFDLKKFYLSQSIRTLTRWFLFILALSAVGVMVGFITSGDYSATSAINAIAKLFWTFCLFPINIVFLFIIFQKNNASVDTILKIILYATMLQVGIAIACYFIPDVKDVFISIMQANNWSERWTINNAADQRMNGFAKSLFDTFGYGMGILASVPFMLTYRTKSLKYLLSLPFIFMAILINTRTGLVIFFIVLLIFFLLLIKHYRRFARQKGNILLMILLLITVPVGANFMGSFMGADSTFSTYTENDINSYIAFLQTGGSEVGSYGGQADVLFSDTFWTLPSNELQLLLGSGISVYGPDSPFEFSSDVGYVNNIWHIGFAGVLILHVTFLSYMWRLGRHQRYWAFFAVVASVSLLFFQIKGSAFWSANLGISATLLLLAVCMYDQKRSEHENQF